MAAVLIALEVAVETPWVAVGLRALLLIAVVVAPQVAGAVIGPQ